MRRVAQVLQVPSAKSGRRTEQEVLDLEFRNPMMEESFVAEVVLERGKTESSGRDLANLQGVFEVRNQDPAGKWANRSEEYDRGP